MASKPIPIRMPDDLIERVDAFAKVHTLSRSAALVILIEAGLDGGTDDDAEPAPRAPSPAPARRAAKAEPAHRPAAPTVKAREVLREAESGAAHLGARAMESAGIAFGNIRGPLQKRVAPPAGSRPGGAKR